MDNTVAVSYRLTNGTIVWKRVRWADVADCASGEKVLEIAVMHDQDPNSTAGPGEGDPNVVKLSGHECFNLRFVRGPEVGLVVSQCDPAGHPNAVTGASADQSVFNVNLDAVGGSQRIGSALPAKVFQTAMGGGSGPLYSYEEGTGTAFDDALLASKLTDPKTLPVT